MTTPDHPNSGEPLPSVRPSQAPAERTHQSQGLVGWARAIALGIRDTAQDMLDEGRKGARDAYEEGWRRYDAKTKRRTRR